MKQSSVATDPSGNMMSLTQVNQIDGERAAGALDSARRQYQELVNECRDGIYQRGTDRRFLFVNPSLCRMLGYEAEELLSLTIDDIRDSGDPHANQVLESADAGREIPPIMAWRFRHSAGHWVPVETSARRLEDGRLQVTVRDISERFRAQEALARQRDLYAALSETNKAIVRAEDHEALFEDVCRIAVQHGKLRFVSIYLLDAGDLSMRYAARFGEDRGYTDNVTISADSARPEGRGPAGTAARTGLRQVFNDFLNEPAIASWHERARRADIRSAAAFPLREAGRVIGTLNLYSSETGFFTEDLLPVLADIAADVSHALDNLAGAVERHRANEALRLSEERFRTLVQATANIVWITDAEGRAISTSPGFEELTGLDRAAALGQGWLQVVHSDDREATMASWRYASENRVSYTVEHRTRMHDGSYRWFSVHGEPILEADGSIREWVGTCTDIDERKLMDHKLRESRQHYLELVQGSGDGIYQRDSDGRFLFVNTAFCRMLGYTPDELLEMSIHDIRELDETRISVHRTPADQGVDHLTLLAVRLRHRDGHYVPVETTTKQLPSGHTQVMVRDVSARVAAEQRLEEERGFIMHSIDSLPGIFYVHDSEGRFLRWNGHLEQVTGYGADEILHMGPAELLAEESRDRTIELVGTALSTGEADAEMDLMTRDGRRLPHYFTARRFVWQGKVCIAGMAIDIRERRSAEERERRYINEARELSRRLLTTQEEERRGIARELHDEVGSALTALQMSLKNIENNVPERLKHLPHASRDIVTTLLGEVRNMCLDLHPSVLDDLGLAAAARWYARDQLRPAGLGVELDIPSDLGRFSAEVESTCFRVLQGAAANALRHSGAKNLTIRLVRTETTLELAVRDDGCGFDVTAARTRANSGASLGILAMEERARLVGGEFSIESAPGYGTAVHVAVYLHKDADAIAKSTKHGKETGPGATGH